MGEDLSFRDRFDAGEKLARELQAYRGKKDALILAIPRGSLEIGSVLAKRLSIPLDVIIVKKIPFPGDPEYAIGAVGIGEHVIDDEAVERSGISKEYIDSKVEDLAGIIKVRYRKYRGDKPIPALKGRTVIVIDDGIATGHTMMAAVRLIRRQKPKRIVLAVPVAPPAALDRFRDLVDEIVCLETYAVFFAIGQFYDSFAQVDDERAIALLKEANT